MWLDDLVPPDKKVQKGKLYLVSLGKAKETRNEQVICSPDADNNSDIVVQYDFHIII